VRPCRGPSARVASRASAHVAHFKKQLRRSLPLARTRAQERPEGPDATPVPVARASQRSTANMVILMHGSPWPSLPYGRRGQSMRHRSRFSYASARDRTRCARSSGFQLLDHDSPVQAPHSRHPVHIADAKLRPDVQGCLKGEVSNCSLRITAHDDQFGFSIYSRLEVTNGLEVTSKHVDALG
jgi:hypothetical protein